MYLLKGKILCKRCNSLMRGKTERNKRVYLCSSYSKNSQSCIRYCIHESDVLQIIEGHLKIKGIKIEDDIEMIRYVKRIEVAPNEGYKIFYKDNSNSIVSINSEIGVKYKL